LKSELKYIKSHNRLHSSPVMNRHVWTCMKLWRKTQIFISSYEFLVNTSFANACTRFCSLATYFLFVFAKRPVSTTTANANAWPVGNTQSTPWERSIILSGALSRRPECFGLMECACCVGQISIIAHHTHYTNGGHQYPVILTIATKLHLWSCTPTYGY